MAPGGDVDRHHALSLSDDAGETWSTPTYATQGSNPWPADPSRSATHTIEPRLGQAGRRADGPHVRAVPTAPCRSLTQALTLSQTRSLTLPLPLTLTRHPAAFCAAEPALALPRGQARPDRQG
eukprot:scaffold12633_cov47-Phaeocystis_antarctica.AAC.1